jgi:hypothetical protein
MCRVEVAYSVDCAQEHSCREALFRGYWASASGHSLIGHLCTSDGTLGFGRPGGNVSASVVVIVVVHSRSRSGEAHLALML